MSIDQQQKSYSTFHSLLANPDHHKTDHEHSSSNTRKLSELSTNISNNNPGSINNSDTGSKDNCNQPTITKTYRSTSENNTTPISYIDNNNIDHSQEIDIARSLPPDINNNNIKNKEDIKLEIDQHKIRMGAKSKPICAILFDYVICGICGAIYYALTQYMNERNQCVPDGDNNPSYCGTMSKTPLLNYPYRNHPVPVSYPYIFGAVTWLFVIFIDICLIKPSYLMIKPIFIKMEALWREVLTSVIITQTAVGFIKKYVGRPRPNYYNYKDIDGTDAISSFPSGHASSSFCIHILLVYHVLGSIYWSYRNDKIICGADNMHSLFGAKIWQKTRDWSSFNVLIVICLLALPVWISCTRITDYYHHYSDVIGGAALGILISTIVFTVFHNELYPHNELYNKSAREPLLSNISDA